MGDWEGFVGFIVIGSMSTPCYKKRILGSKRPKNSPFLVAGGASGKVASKSRHQCKKASEIIPAETAMVEDAVLVRLQKVGACRWQPSPDGRLQHYFAKHCYRVLLQKYMARTSN